MSFGLGLTKHLFIVVVFIVLCTLVYQTWRMSGHVISGLPVPTTGPILLRLPTLIEMQNYSDIARSYDYSMARSIQKDNMFTNNTVGIERLTQARRKLPPGTTTMAQKSTCAVMGNSGILINSSCGQEIDSHEVVLRSNMALVEGFESDVGYKRDIVSMNHELARFVYTCLNNSSPCYDDVLTMIKSYENATIWLSKLGPGPSRRLYLRTISLMEEKLNKSIKAAFPRTRIVHAIERAYERHPSTGVYLLTLAASFCDKISLYGFYPFYETPDGRRLKHHYYDNSTLNYEKHHHMPREFQTLKDLKKLGHIRLVTDKCGPNKTAI